MKEIYLAPEAELLTFVPVEKLANSFWNTWGAGTAKPNDFGDGTETSDGDVEIPFDQLPG